MLFEKRFWVGVADGSITVTFRRWLRPQVLAGRSYRAAGTIIDVVAVDVVDLMAITDDDARAAGYPDAVSLVDDLRGDASRDTYRIEFRPSTKPDPRAALAADADLDDGDVAEISRRLDRLDRASAYGAWTRQTLQLIAAHPARRAGDLAEMAGRERTPFKLDVRKLKSLGLTESLEVGYRLSPRGRAYLDRVGLPA
ncbi:hypothetical protein G1H11_00040 [Phytoactinopolyspora alkaliphila]|uniref:ASCH domain-containing protein n=1 Tax=Phytoactinopolyspora alkaliphila TaxID=1783498 RepID=A0A6N9YF72_9ACTN|nr:hypothetical protein [Phytoactinopolyspora alkaliphila]NED93701.1 hypothetical protein [Phytoactinopolyspora alkaliphila]